jgi:CubicO group peptidase (beta-lactamase class C family)
MTVEILDRLNMNRSMYGLDDLRKFENVTVPYVYNEKEGCLEKVAWPQLGNYEVGGGIRSTVLDLMKYSQVYLNLGVFEGKTIVSPEAIQAMQRPVHQIGRHQYYCYALEVTPNYGGVTLVEHGGGQPGVSSNFGFVPEENISVAVLTNVSDVPASRIWLAAVNTYLGFPIDRQRSYEPEYYMTFEDMVRFCGTYECDEGSKFTIAPAGKELRITIGDREYELRASSEDTLVFDKNGMEQVIKFYLDESQRPWAAFFHLRMLRRVSE